MRLKAFLLGVLILVSACSEATKVTPAERQYIFVPAEISHFPIKTFRHLTTPDHMPYIFFKSFTEQSGFRGLFGTILIGPQGNTVKYLCLVNILPTIRQARDLYSQMTSEPSPRDFGREETIDPGVYHSDEAYLYGDDTSYFHLVVRSSRIVYTVYLDGAKVEEPDVRDGLRTKLAFLHNHLNAIR